MTPDFGPVQRIAVFRALVLGDTLCAVPALRALRRAWPEARISLVGLPVARELAERLDCVDEWLAFPGWPGLPERPVDLAAIPAFLAEMQSRRFDVAVQLHGSGQIVNPLVSLFGARHMAGFHPPDAPPPGPLFCAWPVHGHEVQRLLALCRHLGLATDDGALEFPLRPEDVTALRAAWPAWGDRGPYACVHAGAQLPSRRWPVARFAAVAEALHERRLTVVLTGAPSEQSLVADLSHRLSRRGVPHVDLASRTSLWALGALLRDARVLVCNDTGVSHIAAALRVPSVVVACGSEVARWAPADTRRHRVLAKPAACRPCAHTVCPVGHGCALDLGAHEVVLTLDDLLMHTNDLLEKLPCPAACAS
ncbi:glycosyltransferase family 9 protein [Roseateles cellulosilyticus]|uniref:Glycosyltransferase family 9 protein n=1 Tax=Pelomonas cellulosilytica TaxID=2906762 RepID=A0ABS8XMT2_9BURK|nr:glycosyltransferase family 9 protein [Pelomonas sp. P8]MCE4553133.1 glycosyltransferase family 9 protein [Pelomonas sp. P8]